MRFSVGRVSGLRGYGVGFAPKALRDNTPAATIRTRAPACSYRLSLVCCRALAAKRPAKTTRTLCLR